MEAEAVTSIIRKNSTQRQKLWDQWQQLMDQMDQDLKDPERDPFESHAVNKVMALAHHIGSQHSCESSLSHSDMLRNLRIANLTNAYKPGWKEFVPLAIQIIGSIGSGVLGCVPALGGYTGNQAQAFQAGSQTVNGVFVSGAQGVGGLIHGANQGTQVNAQFEVDAEKRIQGDHDHRRQLEVQAIQRHQEEQRRLSQQKSDAIKTVTAV
jgi:hypothetical protein